MPGFTDQKMRYASRLRDARKAAGLSQEAAAAKVGTSRRHWIRWESGETAPNSAYGRRIAEVLGEPSFVDEDDEESDPMADLMAAIRSLVRAEVSAVRT